jgi:hypothetical protein
VRSCVSVVSVVSIHFLLFGDLEMFCKKVSLCLFVLAIALMIVSQASATTVLGSRAAWNAQMFSTGPVSVDLASLCPAGTYLYVGTGSGPPDLSDWSAADGGYLPQYTRNGVTFACADWAQMLSNNGGSGSDGLGSVMKGYNGSNEILTFPAGTNSVTVDMTGIAAGSHVKATLLMSDATTQVWDVLNDSTATPPYKAVYVGATAATGVTVTSLTFAPEGGAGGYSATVFGNIAYGVAVSTPEPSAIVLLGAGVLSLLAYAWRKRK